MKVPDEYDTVVLFDLDGTLYEGHLWPDLHAIHDVDHEQTDELLSRFRAGEITFEAWLDALADEWGEPDEEAMDAYVDEMSFVDGTEALIEQHEDAYTMLISGALDYISEQVVDELGLDAHVPTVSLTYADDTFTGFDWEPYHEKETVIDDLDADHIIVYGNGWNDRELVKQADEAYMVPNDDRLDYDTLPVETGPLHSFVEDDG